ncbi:hypothetical protein QCE63_19270 [Caballeronia sp. LZ065]|uniref:hypothetical protein n=1 Tax=Caballeronia sp. LZ065 TaxID=3038571 RepID=UPI0028576224|nr:hypothetical protein [Caballeronia sp. LZ065]MDR5781545.1 hypothetical protein [Caballeronia sp. LZ065]
MGRESQHAFLQGTDAHLATANEQIRRHIDLVQTLIKNGHSATSAIELLNVFLGLRQEMIDYRNLSAAVLKEAERRRMLTDSKQAMR